MLRFYAYFKQGTEGSCTGRRPAFWDIVGRWEIDEGFFVFRDEMKFPLDAQGEIRCLEAVGWDAEREGDDVVRRGAAEDCWDDELHRECSGLLWIHRRARQCQHRGPGPGGAGRNQERTFQPPLTAALEGNQSDEDHPQRLHKRLPERLQPQCNRHLGRRVHRHSWGEHRQISRSLKHHLSLFAGRITRCANRTHVTTTW